MLVIHDPSRERPLRLGLARRRFRAALNDLAASTVCCWTPRVMLKQFCWYQLASLPNPFTWLQKCPRNRVHQPL